MTCAERITRLICVLLALLGEERAHALEGMAPQVAVPVVLHLKPSVEVSGEHVTLSDVAACSGVQDLCDEAYAIELGAAPAPGKSQHLPKRKLGETLAKEWPSAEIRFEGAESVRISAGFVEVSEEEVLEALRREIAKKLEGRIDLEVAVEKLQGSSRHKLRPAAYKISFPFVASLDEDHPDKLAQCCIGQKRFDVEFLPLEAGASSEPMARGTYSAHFALKRVLPVAAQRFERGHGIQKDDFEARLVEIPSARSRYAETAEGLVGRRLKRPVEAGNPVTLEQTEVPLALKKGQLVRLSMQRGDLSVSSQVKTMTAGAYGQVIEVMYPATKKRLRARVVDSETVEYVR